MQFQSPDRASQEGLRLQNCGRGGGGGGKEKLLISLCLLAGTSCVPSPPEQVARWSSVSRSGKFTAQEQRPPPRLWIPLNKHCIGLFIFFGAGVKKKKKKNSWQEAIWRAAVWPFADKCISSFHGGSVWKALKKMKVAERGVEEVEGPAGVTLAEWDDEWAEFAAEV